MLVVAFAVLLVVRAVAWQRYARRLPELDARAARVLRRAGARVVSIGTIAPLVLLGIAALLPDVYAVPLQALAGLCAIVAGSSLKFTLVTRAAFNGGFVLPQLPVRGARP